MEGVSFSVTSVCVDSDCLEDLPAFEPLDRVLSNQLSLCLVKPEVTDTEPDVSWDTLSVTGDTHVTDVVVIQRKSQRYQCPLCDRSYAYKCDLAKHRGVHTGALTCTVCGKSCSRNSDLKKHMLIHDAVKMFACTECPKTFALGTSLSKHLRTHTGDKMQVCKKCSKKFVNVADLKKHMRVHSHEQPYSCEFCGKTFSQGGNLKTHIRRLHTKPGEDSSS